MELEKFAEYIQECRKRGFNDDVIRDSLVQKNWSEEDIDRAFAYVNNVEIKEEVRGHEVLSKEIDEEVKKKEKEYGKSVVIFLDEDIRTALEKRAKKNMFSVDEQIIDILRRSTLSMRNKKSLPEDKVDDNLVPLFSRKNTGQKKKIKKKKAKKKAARKKARKEKRVKRKTSRKTKKRSKKK